MYLGDGAVRTEHKIQATSGQNLTSEAYSYNLSLDSILPHREVLLPLLLPLGLQRELVLGQTPADGAGLLGAQVEREPLVLVGLTQRRLLLLRDHRVHPRDGGADHLDLGELVGGAAGDLGDAEEGELRLEVLELTLEVRLVLPPQLVHLDAGHCGRRAGLAAAAAAAAAGGSQESRPLLARQYWVANNMCLHIQNHTRQQKFMWNMELQL